jgi:hypothetical protein
LVNQHPMTVVGVAAPTFHGIDVGEVPSVWIPAVMSAQSIPGFETMLDRRTRWMRTADARQSRRRFLSARDCQRQADYPGMIRFA